MAQQQEIHESIKRASKHIKQFSNHRDLSQVEIAQLRADLSVAVADVVAIGGPLDALQKKTATAEVWLEKRRKDAFQRAKSESTTTEARATFKADPEYLAALYKYETSKNETILLRDWVKSAYQVLNSMGSKLSN